VKNVFLLEGKFMSAKSREDGSGYIRIGFAIGEPAIELFIQKELMGTLGHLVESDVAVKGFIATRNAVKQGKTGPYAAPGIEMKVQSVGPIAEAVGGASGVPGARRPA